MYLFRSRASNLDIQPRASLERTWTGQDVFRINKVDVIKIVQINFHLTSSVHGAWTWSFTWTSSSSRNTARGSRQIQASGSIEKTSGFLSSHSRLLSLWFDWFSFSSSQSSPWPRSFARQCLYDGRPWTSCACALKEYEPVELCQAAKRKKKFFLSNWIKAGFCIGEKIRRKRKKDGYGSHAYVVVTVWQMACVSYVADERVGIIFYFRSRSWWNKRFDLKSELLFCSNKQ